MINERQIAAFETIYNSGEWSYIKRTVIMPAPNSYLGTSTDNYENEEMIKCEL